ncbi:MAG: GxxExxY protein [Terriglobales bacterium]|jgi:GxxExxY protein
MTENQVGTTIIKAAIEVHRHLGPGLLETVYESVLAHELTARGLSVQRQVPVSFEYKGIRFDIGFRADMIVNGIVIIELKSVEAVSAAHRKQIQTYLRLTGAKLGYLLNFGAAVMKEGIVRAVSGLEEENANSRAEALRRGEDFHSCLSTTEP